MFRSFLENGQLADERQLMDYLKLSWGYGERMDLATSYRTFQAVILILKPLLSTHVDPPIIEELGNLVAKIVLDLSLPHNQL